jgi:rsbT co-antagonist protein RsbR
MATTADIPAILSARREELVSQWLTELQRTGASQGGRLRNTDLEGECRRFVDLLLQLLQTGGGPGRAETEAVTGFLTDLSRARAAHGFSPSDTANFVLALKLPCFAAIEAALTNDAAGIAAANREVTVVLDRLALFTMEAYQRSREEIIIRQQREITELSTPVVKLWDGVLALPLIGTLDSERTQVVMENLLQSILDHAAEIAIIDITGVPTVDTLVAQHLLKAIAAARLMGADCIVSGIRPQIAQTMVHLGVELNVVSKASLADAFALALARIGRRVTSVEAGHA